MSDVKQEHERKKAASKANPPLERPKLKGIVLVEGAKPDPKILR